MIYTGKPADPPRDGRSYEQQRFEHLVLGKHRPKSGASSRKTSRRAKAKPPVRLAPGIEEAVALREQWSHKQGTAQTHQHHESRREGAMSRLYSSGAIDADQLAAAVAIAAIGERLAADVHVRTCSLETRIDLGRRGGDLFFESLANVRREVAYTRWRGLLGRGAAAVLDMVVGDMALSIAGELHHTGTRRLKKLLVSALDLWPRIYAETCRDVGQTDLDATHARLDLHSPL
jgi:hypothetical protein